jgi:hypothetical protein
MSNDSLIMRQSYAATVSRSQALKGYFNEAKAKNEGVNTKSKGQIVKLNEAELRFVAQNLRTDGGMPTRHALMGQVSSLFKYWNFNYELTDSHAQ